jgi:hypothetical protein
VDLGTLLLLGFLWLVFNAIRKAGSKPPGSPRSTPRPPPGGSARPGPRPATQVRLRTGTGLDATQREGSRLDELLRELGRTLDQVSGPAGRAPDRVPDGAPDGAPVVRSLETDPGRPERVLVDQDDEAEQVIARRLAAAEAHLQPRTRADHQAFDARIRQEPADKTVTPAYTARQLRDAVVWREILGPPVSLRGEEER